jgi:pimeloyl-ACP methyl ester carboxylesterase
MNGHNQGVADAKAHLNGIELAWRDVGLGDSRPVLLLHALGQHSGDWDFVARGLSDAGYRAVSPDFRGHAASGTAREYSFEAMRDDTLALIEHLGLEHFTLIGHSMGGTVAYLVAETIPGRVKALIIEDTPPPGGPVAMARRPRAGTPQEFVPTAQPFDRALVAPIRAQLASPNPSWWDDLVAVTCPVLLIGGGYESPINPDALAAVVDRVPVAQLVSLGGGHFVHENRPDEFLLTVLDFLARLPG